MKKKGQMKLSFGMIFSIILIVLFLIFGFFAIQKFLEFQEKAKTIKFYEGIEGDIDSVWSSTKGSKKVEYFLPKNAELFCIVGGNPAGIGLYGDFRIKSHEAGDRTWREEIGLKYFEKIDATYDDCVQIKNQRIKFYIKKEYGDSQVKIDLTGV